MESRNDVAECSGATDGYRAIADEVRAAMEHRRGMCPDQLTRDGLREAGCSELVCVLPKDFDERIRYLGNTLVQMLTRTKVDDQLRATVGELCQALSYMLNSSSWRDGELHEFDRDELKRKLGRFAR